MTSRTLLLRSLAYYWRTNLAVVAGTAVAVSVLAGALLTGESVRASLRRLALERLGNTGSVITAPDLFREALAESFPDSAPLIQLTGLARHQPTGRLASQVHIYGVDDRFWRFHGLDRHGPDAGEVLLSEPLARELGSAEGEGILLRLEEASYIPAESLHGQKEDAGKTIRLTAAATLTAGQLGEFSLEANQGAVRAAFVSLRRLQEELGQPERINMVLLPPDAEGVEVALTESLTPEDLGVRAKQLPSRPVLQVESWAGLLSDSLAASVVVAARSAGLTPEGRLTYLANTIRVRNREIPYSLVTATTEVPAGSQPPEIALNQWAARELGARPGDPVTVEYFVWQPDGGLETRTADFQVGGIRPLERDPDLAPEYPGITDSDDVTDWDPPFPVDLNRIRPQDEAYWDEYRTTPKAFIPLETGQALWRSRWGGLTAYRMPVPGGSDPQPALDRLRSELRKELNPLEHGFAILPVRTLALQGSQGATDFGEYFVYFSFFVIVSALLLVGLFFRLGVEQRVRETGLLEAIGLPQAGVRKQLLTEGLVLAAAGALLGAAGALAYCQLILYGLRTWWVDAVGTRSIELNPDPVWLLVGAAGGMAAAVFALWLTLRGLRRISPRARLAGEIAPQSQVGRSGSFRTLSLASVVLALGSLGASAAGLIPNVAGFFGAGGLLLVAALLLLRAWLARRDSTVQGRGPMAVLRLGFRNVAYRPGRTILSVALISSAIFLIVAVDSFRLRGAADLADPQSPTGGFPLMAESALPIYRSPSNPDAREALGLDTLPDINMVPFRLRPGDDVSCLNLYRPQNPRVLGAPADFLASGRFRFQSSLAETPDENANPWLLLQSDTEDGAIPAAVAANSLTYVLHRKLGDIVELPQQGGKVVRLRLVAALADSVFQRELIISEEHFREAFPEVEGYRVFLINAPPEDLSGATTELEDLLTDFGFDVASTGERLASFHRVENTYLSTFQSLGALGLILGTVGLGVILLRNVLERRRELALLRAVGYRSGAIAGLILAENLWMLTAGVVIGTVTALLAIAPALAGRGGSVSPLSLLTLLAAVLVVGVLSSWAATRAAVRSELLEALRAE